MKVWLHRHNSPTWLFEKREIVSANDNIIRRLIHMTDFGNVYSIFFEPNEYKNIWIGRLKTGDRYEFWYTVEKEIKAHWIEFENGGRYFFPD